MKTVDFFLKFVASGNVFRPIDAWVGTPGDRAPCCALGFVGGGIMAAVVRSFEYRPPIRTFSRPKVAAMEAAWGKEASVGSTTTKTVPELDENQNERGSIVLGFMKPSIRRRWGNDRLMGHP